MLAQGLDALQDVIWHLETYDMTSIRASTPMYFLARKIKAMGIKMVLSGEGADEVFGGYLYFHAAPSPMEFHRECVRRVKHLHSFDLLRANKSTMAWGLEVRVPFLDKEFLDVAMNIRPEVRVLFAFCSLPPSGSCVVERRGICSCVLSFSQHVHVFYFHRKRCTERGR